MQLSTLTHLKAALEPVRPHMGIRKLPPALYAKVFQQVSQVVRESACFASSRVHLAYADLLSGRHHIPGVLLEGDCASNYRDLILVEDMKPPSALRLESLAPVAIDETPLSFLSLHFYMGGDMGLVRQSYARVDDLMALRSHRITMRERHSIFFTKYAARFRPVHVHPWKTTNGSRYVVTGDNELSRAVAAQRLGYPYVAYEVDGERTYSELSLMTIAQKLDEENS